MQISALEEYGVRCALQLARFYSEGPIPASRIAEKEGLSVEYVSKIMHLFRKGGLVQASRGNLGGFFLAQSPAQTSIQMVLNTLQAKKNSVAFCSRYPGQTSVCTHTSACSLRPVWKAISSYVEDVLSKLTLQDLITQEPNKEVGIYESTAQIATV